MQSWIDVATITGRKNLDGRLVVRGGANLLLLEPGKKVHLVPPQLDVPRCTSVTFFQHIGEGSALLTLDKVEDISSAEALIGCHILIEGKENEEMVSINSENTLDVVGWRFCDLTSGATGSVVSVIERDVQPLLSVRIGSHEYLVPFAEDLIDTMDTTAHSLSMNCPQGLFNI